MNHTLVLGRTVYLLAFVDIIAIFLSVQFSDPKPSGLGLLLYILATLWATIVGVYSILIMLREKTRIRLYNSYKIKPEGEGGGKEQNTTLTCATLAFGAASLLGLLVAVTPSTPPAFFFLRLMILGLAICFGIIGWRLDRRWCLERREKSSISEIPDPD